MAASGGGCFFFFFFIKDSLKALCFFLFFLAFSTSLFHLFYLSSLSTTLYFDHPPINPISKINPQPVLRFALPKHTLNHSSLVSEEQLQLLETTNTNHVVFQEPAQDHEIPAGIMEVGSSENDDEKDKDTYLLYHDGKLFMEEYKEMNSSLKIYVYPHEKNDPFANVFLPMTSEPGGNYASEAYFKKALFNSHFITNDPSQAHLFYLPFSIASLRHDKRIGVGGIQDFIKNYVANISRIYPFWNRTGGADHFYVACHSIGRSAMNKAVQVKLNAIQLVCSSSYFLQGYVSHKDASIPQIWPRNGDPPIRAPSQRRSLAFYAGAMNSRVRELLVKTWGHDSDISVHRSRLKTSYSEALLGSKFCVHAKGFEVNTARIGDALYYGCVPVILADYYDLPYADILNWERFSVVLTMMDIANMKKILEHMVSGDEYLKLQGNVMRVQKHFQWHTLPLHFDAFYMVMYELWLRRSHVSISFHSFSH